MRNSRRKFIKQAAITGLTAAVVGPLAACTNSELETTASSSPDSNPESDSNEKALSITLAGYAVNRLTAIIDGRAKIEGCDLTFTKSSIGDMNTDTFAGSQTFDVTEIGLHPFMLAYANDGFRDYTLLPNFPLRIFRHKSVFIRNDRGINSPEDLKGKTIGTAGYSSTSLTWLRGIFQDEYGIKPEDVNWVVSNKDSSADASGKISKQEQVNPDGISIKMGTAGLDESELLMSGEVDALFHAAEPKAYIDGNPLVVRLFPNSKRVEQAYFSKTGIFPIMHAVAIRKSLLEKEPWLVKAVFNAYSASKTLDYKFMKKLGWAYETIPWYGQELEETKALMGENFWPYGIESNRKTLETLFRYSYEQGLSSKELTIEDLFHSSGLELIET